MRLLLTELNSSLLPEMLHIVLFYKRPRFIISKVHQGWLLFNNITDDLPILISHGNFFIYNKQQVPHNFIQNSKLYWAFKT